MEKKQKRIYIYILISSCIGFSIAIAYFALLFWKDTNKQQDWELTALNSGCFMTLFIFVLMGIFKFKLHFSLLILLLTWNTIGFVFVFYQWEFWVENIIETGWGTYGVYYIVTGLMQILTHSFSLINLSLCIYMWTKERKSLKY